jgi:hypothetical protein
MNKQCKLFKNKKNWEKDWDGMPEYNNKKEPGPFIIAEFKFKNQKDFDEFHALLKKHIYKTKGKIFDGMQRKNKKNAWYPLKEKASNYEYI